jgi:hypothetical protein
MLTSLKVGINENSADMTTSVMTLLPNVIEIIQMGHETHRLQSVFLSSNRVKQIFICTAIISLKFEII